MIYNLKTYIQFMVNYKRKKMYLKKIDFFMRNTGLDNVFFFALYSLIENKNK